MLLRLVGHLITSREMLQIFLSLSVKFATGSPVHVGLLGNLTADHLGNSQRPRDQLTVLEMVLSLHTYRDRGCLQFLRISVTLRDTSWTTVRPVTWLNE